MTPSSWRRLASKCVSMRRPGSSVARARGQTTGGAVHRCRSRGCADITCSSTVQLPCGSPVAVGVDQSHELLRPLGLAARSHDGAVLTQITGLCGGCSLPASAELVRKGRVQLERDIEMSLQGFDLEFDSAEAVPLRILPRWKRRGCGVRRRFETVVGMNGVSMPSRAGYGEYISPSSAKLRRVACPLPLLARGAELRLGAGTPALVFPPRGPARVGWIAVATAVLG